VACLPVPRARFFLLGGLHRFFLLIFLLVQNNIEKTSAINNVPDFAFSTANIIGPRPKVCCISDVTTRNVAACNRVQNIFYLTQPRDFNPISKAATISTLCSGMGVMRCVCVCVCVCARARACLNHCAHIQYSILGNLRVQGARAKGPETYPKTIRSNIHTKWCHVSGERIRVEHVRHQTNNYAASTTIHSRYHHVYTAANLLTLGHRNMLTPREQAPRRSPPWFVLY
jgi:hypothetical protein